MKLNSQHSSAGYKKLAQSCGGVVMSCLAVCVLAVCVLAVCVIAVCVLAVCVLAVCA